MDFKKLNVSPLFILGNPRSGTSLLRLMLTNHCEIIVPPECGLILWLEDKYTNWTFSKSSVESFVVDLISCRKFETWALDKSFLTEYIFHEKPLDFSSLCRTVYAAYAHKNNKSVTIWGDKNNYYIHHLDRLLSIYPESRFLHIVRDGRDVACSYKEVMEANYISKYAPVLSLDVEEIAIEWSRNVTRIDDFIRQRSDVKSKTVRYEDLVASPANVLNDISSWLGVRFDHDMLDYYKSNRSEGLEPASTLEWKTRTLQPVSSATVGRFKENFSDDDKVVFLKIAEDVLKKYSYE